MFFSIGMSSEMIIRLSDPDATSAPLSAAEFETLMSHVQGGALVVDAASGKVLYRNAQAADLLHDSEADDTCYDSYVFGAYRADGRHYLPHEFPVARALAGETIKDAEVVYQCAGRLDRHVSMNASPVFDVHGTVLRAIVTFADISAQRRAEHALRDARQKLSFTLHGANTMPWTLTVASGHAVIEESWFALLGYASSEIKPSLNALLSILHPHDRPGVLRQWHDHLHGRTPFYEASCRLRTAGHEWRWVLIRGLVIERNVDGTAMRAVGALLDIDDIKRIELALRDSEQRFRSIFEHAATGIATVSPAGRWLTVNSKITEILGYDADAMMCSGTIADIMHGDDAGRFSALFDEIVQARRRSIRLEQRCLRGNGDVAWIDLTLSAVSDEHVGVKYLIAIMEDKTEATRARQEMEKVQAHLRMATQLAGLGFWEWNLDSGDICFSKDWVAHRGYSDAELRTRVEEWKARIHPDDRERVLAHIDAFKREPASDYAQEFRMLDLDDTYRWINVRGVPILDERGRVQKMMGTHVDITEQKNAQEIARQRAQHDPLTGLPMRGLLYEFSEHMLASARRAATPLAVLFIDLDHFKTVNDTHGHKVGDGVLKEVAGRLGHLMRAEDVIGRLGGDEFVAILPKTGSRDDAAVVAAKALESLRAPYFIDGLELHVSPSIGISLYPNDGDTIDMLIQRADAAMYRVKHGERNNFRFFAPEWNEDPRAELEERMRTGLERGEFDLHYQPVIDTRTGALLSVEALLRWRPDGNHAIDPAIFLPVAESSGLIVPLGEWTLHEACLQHRDWLRQGLPPISIAVNVSAAQLLRDEFQQHVGSAIEAAGVDPEYIEIELAESTLMKNFDDALAQLHDLKQLGLKIALDDFGTGYSNLHQLSRLPIDKLKVDRSFVRYLAHDTPSLAMAEAIIAIGRRLGIDVIAEGIESEQDMTVLREHDCHHAQGFHIGRPMPGQQFVQWYNEHRLH
jgi:diguanylate cyclase (GGDEF)-like protein/PAS domain S-box-containing protein